MKLIFSESYKVLVESPYHLIELLKKHDTNNVVKGFEVNFDIDIESNKLYLKELKEICDEENYEISIHSQNKDIEKELEFLDFMNSMNFKKRLVITYHPVTADTLEEEIKQTNLYLSEILNYVYNNNYRFDICIENLNSNHEGARLDKNHIKDIIFNNEDLNFTYDIGHEICEYGHITDLDDEMSKRIKQVHLHTFDNTHDHREITDMDPNKQKWFKGLEYLKSIKYEGTISLEYDFNLLGDTFDERVINYIKSAEYIYNYINKGE